MGSELRFWSCSLLSSGKSKWLWEFTHNWWFWQERGRAAHTLRCELRLPSWEGTMARVSWCPLLLAQQCMWGSSGRGDRLALPGRTVGR